VVVEKIGLDRSSIKICIAGKIPCQPFRSHVTHNSYHAAPRGVSKFRELVDYMLFICETSLITMQEKLDILIPRHSNE